MIKFIENHTLEFRRMESSRILNKFPDRIPIIVEKSTQSQNTLPDIDKKKYLVPNDLTLGQFIYVIRKRIKLKPEKALYLFVNNTLPVVSSTIGQIYNEHKHEDGFVYFIYAAENTFGTY